MWNEGHQLLWKGRLAKYAFRGIHVGLYLYGCLVPGQTLPNVTVSRGIADTPGEQVKILLGAFGVPGHATVEHPITFEIVDDETKQCQSSQLPPKFNTDALRLVMVDNKYPVLIEVPPPSSLAAMCAHQHYTNGHTDNEGPSRADTVKHLGKQQVAFDITEALVAPLHSSSSASPVKPSHTTTEAHPVLIPPLTHGEKKPPPTVRLHIYMQSHKALPTEADATIILSLPDITPTPTPKQKTHKCPLSVNEEPMLLLDDSSNSDEKKDGEVGNIFQRGLTVHHRRGAPSKVASRRPKDESKKMRGGEKKLKYKSTEFIDESPSPSPTTTSTSACRPVPHPVPHPVPPCPGRPDAPLSGHSKSPSIVLPLDKRTQVSLTPLGPHQPPTGPMGSTEGLARLIQPPLHSTSGPPSSQDQPQQQPLPPPLPLPSLPLESSSRRLPLCPHCCLKSSSNSNCIHLPHHLGICSNSRSLRYLHPLAKLRNPLLPTHHRTLSIMMELTAHLLTYHQTPSITTTLAIHTTKAMWVPILLLATWHTLIHTIHDMLPISLFKKGVVCLGRKDSHSVIICRWVGSRWVECQCSGQEGGSTMVLQWHS